MMRKSLAVLVLVLSSCGSMKEGTIVNKYIEPANDYYAWIPIQTGMICTPIGQTTSCTPIFTPFPFLMHDDEDYAIVLESCKNGDCKRGRRDLNPVEYERVSIGEFWSEKNDGKYLVKDSDERKRRADPSEMPEGSDS